MYLNQRECPLSLVQDSTETASLRPDRGLDHGQRLAMQLERARNAFSSALQVSAPVHIPVTPCKEAA